MIRYVLLSSGNPNQNYIFTQITKWTVVILCSSQIENKWRFNLAWGYCKVSILAVKSLPSFCAWLFQGCKNFKVAVNKISSMVFYYRNCSDPLWEKNVLVIERNLLKFEAEDWEFAKFLRSVEQFIQTVQFKQLLVTIFF